MSLDDRRILDDIAEYGCHVVLVREQGELPPFAYSVGIHRTAGAPELIVIGLRHDQAHAIVNEYCRRASGGETFRVGERYGDFLEDCDVMLRAVDRVRYEEYLGVARWLYEGDEFPVLQLVWPSRDGLWPWAEGVSESFRARQPVLDSADSPPPPAVPHNLAAIVCPHVFDASRPVLYVSRSDGDWQFLCGDEHPDAEGARVVRIGHLLDRHPSLRALLDLPPDWEAERASLDADWSRFVAPPDERE